MSLKKKDPSLRVAANDPHLVSLGGGRLSTAVTIHYIPIGDMTIGSSPTCSVSLNGSGVRPVHCTIYRSEENEVTIVPENDARVLIDGTKLVDGETNLTQGAMITIGNSNYLRFNNPAEAQLIRSAMGSNERISMPQIDFTQVPRRNSNRSSISNGGNGSSEEAQIEAFYESKIHPKESSSKLINNIDINGLTCPKVFTADSITVNTPAKDVLGPKYANFAKNLAENHRNEKNQKMNNYVNIPTTNYHQQQQHQQQQQQHQQYHNSNLNSSSSSTNGTGGNEILAKVNNNLSNNSRNTTPYDKYPKSYGGLQLFPMNGVNTEINTSSSSYHSVTYESLAAHNSSQQNISAQENERLEEILKICTEYERQNSNSNSNSSVTSSPIVQNRIKTNGSLPREKKGPFYDLSPQHSGGHSKVFFPEKAKTSSGYENVRLIGDRRVEIGNGSGSGSGTPASGSCIGSPKSGYENVIVGKYVPQSPRTKIRTTCMSPKKDSSFNGFQIQQKPQTNHSTSDYEQLIQTFEDKLKMEMQAIQDKSRLASPTPSRSEFSSPSTKRPNKNINNLTLNLSFTKKDKEKPVPAVRTIKTNMTVPVFGGSDLNASDINLEKLKITRKELQANILMLRAQIGELRLQEENTLRGMDTDKSYESTELVSTKDTLAKLEKSFTSLQTKIHRLEAQRNATRVMEENQQAKLKQSIAIKQDQVKRLKTMLKEKPSDDCLNEEFNKCSESLENDRKTFEDLEFQYLEEESDWQAYREELHMEQKDLSSQIDDNRIKMRQLETVGAANRSSACSEAKAIKDNLLSLINELRENKEELRTVEANISDITGELNGQSDPSSENDDDDDDEEDDDDDEDDESEMSPADNQQQHGIMSQSLFGSAEILCPKRHPEDIMSKSVNENMFYNNKIELPSQQHPVTSTPKRKLEIVDIKDDLINDPPALPPRQIPRNSLQDSSPSSIEDQVVRRLHKEAEDDPLLKLKYNMNDEQEQQTGERVNFNLSLGSDDFEVNPLERRIPSQDDIDRISKVTSDAPISTKGASNKIFDSIKEIERNRQLLLAQQGSHVIEHARQKMVDLKKKSHDEARAQYLSMLSTSLDNSTNNKDVIESTEMDNLTDKENRQQQQQVGDADRKINKTTTNTSNKHSSSSTNANSNNNESNNDQNKSSQNRHSQPELESQRSRPLSEANSELSCDLLSENTYKSSIELSSSTGGGGSGSGGGGGIGGGNNRHSEQSDDGKRSSVNSSDTTNSDRLTSGNKRSLPKHQRPLTRYLPIFSPDLDLRQHIESAGHQIAQCPHVFVDSYSCRGYLHKLGATFHGWSRRWFVLDRQRNAFIYYSDKSERKPRGGAYFSTIDEVYLDHLNASKSGRPHCTFIVKTKKRSYHLQAASDAAARIWIDAIITGAQGNLDY
ncbi:pleckstrin homology-like domain family B member 1 isoform X2 [Episyrphus balteatus]|nr:pleckstrin homology-like domain family B member 1 isoform X2 [Episyrphus balteatus]